MTPLRIFLVVAGALLIFSPGMVASQATAEQPHQQTAPNVPQRVRAGGQAMGAKLIHKVDPVYPGEAMMKHVKGTVHLRIVVDRDGTVIETNVVSGNALLTKSAIEAVRQWVYRPTTINHVPVQVQTDVDVTFKLLQ